MAAPSKSFKVIPDSDVDADSPGSTNLFVELRNNDIHLEEWLGFSFTAAQDHNHDGTNSKQIESTDLLNPNSIGGFRFVGRIELPGSSSTATFSILDGDTDTIYKLVCRILASNTGDIVLRPNAVSTNLTTRFDDDAGAGTDTSEIVIANFTGSGTRNIIIEGLFFADKSIQSNARNRQWLGTYAGIDNTTPFTAGFIGQSTGLWAETATNVTSLEIRSLSAAMSAGSTFTLYKLAIS